MVELKDRQQQETEGKLHFHSGQTLKVCNLKVHMWGAYCNAKELIFQDVQAQGLYEALKSAVVETVLPFSCLWLRRLNQLSPEEVAARAGPEKTQVIFDQLSGEEKKKSPLSDSPGGGAAVCHPCEHMGIC